jgi:hypothetical protein
MIKFSLVHFSKLTCFSFLFLLSFSSQAKRTEYHIELKNHLFYPAKIIIPVNEKVKLVIHNSDDTVEEFDSFDLNREKVIFANRSAIIFIGPLPEGEYSFFGEYNPHSARGKIIVGETSQYQDFNKGEQNVN